MTQLCIKHGNHNEWELLHGQLLRCSKCIEDRLLSAKISKLKSRDKAFNLTIQFVKDLIMHQNNRCALSGQLFESVKDISIDRIDSSEGYIKSNVQLVTAHANVAKWTKSTEEFIQLCEQVVKFNQSRSLIDLVNFAEGASQPIKNPAGTLPNSGSALGTISGVP